MQPPSLNILVLGASKGTGAATVRAALDAGHRVTAFSRDPQKLVLEHPQLTRVAGSVHDAASLAAAVPGHDAVVLAASPSGLSGFKANPRFFSLATEHTIAAMKQANVKRFVVLSALGTNDSRALLNPVLRLLMVDWILKVPYADHERQEAMVKQSGLEWVIARPTRLFDGPAKKQYRKTKAIERVPSSISRDDVADFLVEACVVPDWVESSVQLGG